MIDDPLRTAYASVITGTTVRSRLLRFYIEGGLSICDIAVFPVTTSHIGDQREQQPMIACECGCYSFRPATPVGNEEGTT